MASSEKPLPPPPWMRGAHKPVKRQLSFDSVLSSAMRVLEKEGLEKVTMRRVAQELDTGAASLYAYVGNKAELHELLYDAALAPVRIPEPDPGRWRAQLLDLGLDVVRALVAKPGTARVALETAVPTTPKALQIVDAVLGLLAAGGVPQREALEWSDIYSLQLTAAAYEMSLRRDPEEMAEEGERRATRIAEYLDVLPEDALPHLRATLPLFGEEDGASDTDESGDEARSGGRGESASLRRGLEMLLDGLAADEA